MKTKLHSTSRAVPAIWFMKESGTAAVFDYKAKDTTEPLGANLVEPVLHLGHGSHSEGPDAGEGFQGPILVVPIPCVALQTFHCCMFMTMVIDQVPHPLVLALRQILFLLAAEPRPQTPLSMPSITSPPWPVHIPFVCAPVFTSCSFCPEIKACKRDPCLQCLPGFITAPMRCSNLRFAYQPRQPLLMLDNSPCNASLSLNKTYNRMCTAASIGRVYCNLSRWQQTSKIPLLWQHPYENIIKHGEAQDYSILSVAFDGKAEEKGVALRASGIMTVAK